MAQAFLWVMACLTWGGGVAALLTGQTPAVLYVFLAFWVVVLPAVVLGAFLLDYGEELLRALVRGLRG